MDRLPEDCIAKVLSLTSPKDACRLSVVEKTFRSAADSNVVWLNFMPPDHEDIISQAESPLPPHPSSCKQRYLRLSDHPLIIDQGKKSFSVEKSSGKKCYMLSARDLTIVWGDTPSYWTWPSLPHSRFYEVAELKDVCWLEIRGNINVSLLSPNTNYAAFLVFKTTAEAYGFEYRPIEFSIGVRGGEANTRTVYLDPHMDVWGPWVEEEEEEDEAVVEVVEEGIFPRARGDGWMEIELGDYYYNGNGVDDEQERELEMSLMEVNGGNWKRGLIVEGIDIRPKVVEE